MLKLSNDLIKFRIILVKTYYETSKTIVIEKNVKNDISNEMNANVNANDNKNKKKPIDRNFDENENRNSGYFFDIQNQLEKPSIKRDRDRSRKHSIKIIKYNSSNLCFMINDFVLFSFSFSYIDAVLFLYIAFRQKKFRTVKKIFKFVNHVEIFFNARIFNVRFVNEIKNADIEKTFEK